MRLQVSISLCIHDIKHYKLYLLMAGRYVGSRDIGHEVNFFFSYQQQKLLCINSAKSDKEWTCGEEGPEGLDSQGFQNRCHFLQMSKKYVPYK